MSLIVSYSGLRGIVGESLTPEVAFRFARAFGELLKLSGAKVLLGRDTRASGEALLQAVAEGLSPFGTLVDLGIVATPTLQFSLEPLAAHAAVCVTASHNPQQWNGMKFFTGVRKTVLDGAEIRALCALYEAEKGAPTGAQFQSENAHATAIEQHVERVLQQVNVSAIRARAFKVAIDSGHGAGQEAAERLLRALGCDVRVVESARESEPVAEALGDLVRAVHGCDVGFAQDLDADRLALVTETGTAPGEEATLVLVVDHLLRRHPRAQVVINSATTRAVSDVVTRHGGSLREVPVGEVNLSRALLTGGTFGGEGNGGVIYPPVSLGRDSLIGMALVLDALAEGEETLSQRLAALPRYESRKLKLPRGGGLDALYARVRALFPQAQSNTLDGLKLVFADGSWLSVRPSNTEPIVRVTLESQSRGWLDETVGKIIQT